ncbi:MAG: hypothetical protein ACXW2X_11270 [Thermoanaerobaculia bacterium]
MADVNVIRVGNLVHAKSRGTMNMDLVRDAERKIEWFLDNTAGPVVLYDTLEMDTPTMELALEMKKFDGRIRDKVLRSATVVRDAGTAFMAKVAFVFSREHKVFYGDLDKALTWLRAAQPVEEAARVK